MYPYLKKSQSIVCLFGIFSIFAHQILNVMKQIIFYLLLSIAFIANSFSQQTAQSLRRTIDYKKLTDTSHSLVFVETDPPTGEPRFVAEFEPMQGVMIRYPLGIPESLVADFTKNCQVYCIVVDSCQNEAYQTFVNGGVNMDRVTFVNAPTENYFVCDYGPWYIFEDRLPAIVDNLYYPMWSPKSDSVSWAFSEFWNIPIYEMNLNYEGGNMMQDGRGQGVSDANVLYNNDEETLRNRMRDFLGIDPIHLISPNYPFAHVDCWGKYLAPDIILIAKMPESSSFYLDFEEVATFFTNSNCCWGYPYRVYRVNIPDNGWYNTVAPYTNSLILNKTVYVPVLNDSILDQDAIAVYQEAMPGYDIVAVEGCENTPWVAGDALHCRTRGVMDFDMLFVDHRDVIFGEQAWQDSIAVTSKFIAYSGANLKQDSLLVYYSIDGGAYQTAHMTATGNPDEYVGYIKGYQLGSQIDYYVFGADESGHRYTQPVFAALDPHHFWIESNVGFAEFSTKLHVYPNPTTGQFTVEGANVAKVEVYNLVGQKVHEAEGQVVNIDAADWNKGIYLVNIIEQNGAVVTKKLVVR